MDEKTEIDMDQFFTNPTTASQCMKILDEFLNTCTFNKPIMFLDPCIGVGAFYNLFPTGKKFGYEIDSGLCEGKDFICQDFLTVKKFPKGLDIIVCSNPPFSLGTSTMGRKRNVQAEFIQHCQFLGCSVIAFLVGASMHRLRKNPVVKNLTLVHSTFLPQTEFITRDGQIKLYNVYFDIFIPGKAERIGPYYHPNPIPFSFSQLQSQLRPWKFSNSNDFDLCFIRWGSNCSVIEKDPPPSISDFATQSRFFYILFCGISREEFEKFLLTLPKYLFSISTISSTSLSLYEVFYLWDLYSK